MRAVVICESMVGDNQQVALAIAAGLAEAGVATEAIEVGVAPSTIGGDVDLLVVGTPNHAWSLPRPSTRQDAAAKLDTPGESGDRGSWWLGSAACTPGLRTVSYDTRGSHPKVVVAMDHASTSIHKGLTKLGGTRLVPAKHFRVSTSRARWSPAKLNVHAPGA